MTILFQGDSVTDCGRDRTDPHGLGNGYVREVAAVLLESTDTAPPIIFNRGIGGNRVRDLAARWEEDCLALEPDVISILIGINDVWRQFDSNQALNPGEVVAQYRELLERSSKLRPKLILMEPFLIPTMPEKVSFRTVLDPLLTDVRTLAMEFGARLVPLDGLFAAACSWRPAAFWAGDGIHPTPAGHRLIADSWLQAYRELERSEPPLTHFTNLHD